MRKDQIAEFIGEVIDLGCDPIAVGDDASPIGDGDLPEDVGLSISDALWDIAERYGDYDHLHFEIIDYLNRIGRVYRHEDRPHLPN